MPKGKLFSKLADLFPERSKKGYDGDLNNPANFGPDAEPPRVTWMDNADSKIRLHNWSWRNMRTPGVATIVETGNFLYGCADAIVYTYTFDDYATLVACVPSADSAKGVTTTLNFPPAGATKGRFAGDDPENVEQVQTTTWPKGKDPTEEEIYQDARNNGWYEQSDGTWKPPYRRPQEELDELKRQKDIQTARNDKIAADRLQKEIDRRIREDDLRYARIKQEEYWEEKISRDRAAKTQAEYDDYQKNKQGNEGFTQYKDRVKMEQEDYEKNKKTGETRAAYDRRTKKNNKDKNKDTGPNQGTQYDEGVQYNEKGEFIGDWFDNPNMTPEEEADRLAKYLCQQEKKRRCY